MVALAWTGAAKQTLVLVGGLIKMARGAGNHASTVKPRSLGRAINADAWYLCVSPMCGKMRGAWIKKAATLGIRGPKPVLREESNPVPVRRRANGCRGSLVRIQNALTGKPNRNLAANAVRRLVRVQVGSGSLSMRVPVRALVLQTPQNRRLAAIAARGLEPVSRTVPGAIGEGAAVKEYALPEQRNPACVRPSAVRPLVAANKFARVRANGANVASNRVPPATGMRAIPGGAAEKLIGSFAYQTATGQGTARIRKVSAADGTLMTLHRHAIRMIR